jgi:hypothetical protein
VVVIDGMVVEFIVVDDELATEPSSNFAIAIDIGIGVITC